MANAIKVCPKCGSSLIDYQVVQENHGGRTITKTKSQYRQKRHGLLWWMFIGWWWWMIDLFLWIFLFIPRLIIQCFRRKKYVGKSTSVSSSKNKIRYKTLCLCKDCGNNWTA